MVMSSVKGSRVKQFVVLCFLVVVAMSLVACSSGGDSSSSSTSESSSEQAQAGPSQDLEKFSQLKVGMTIDEVEELLGEPTSSEENTASYDKTMLLSIVNKYNVSVEGQDMPVTVYFDGSKKTVKYFDASINGIRPYTPFADGKADFSAVSDLEDKKITTYDEVASAFKSPGFLYADNESGRKSYLWVDSSDNDYYLTITFDGDEVLSYTGLSDR